MYANLPDDYLRTLIAQQNPTLKYRLCLIYLVWISQEFGFQL